MVMMVGIDVRYRWTKDPPRGGSKARKYVTWFGNRDAVGQAATPFRENNRHKGSESTWGIGTEPPCA